MRIGHYQFQPRLIPTLATLILLPILMSLGFWQLDRTEEKRRILEQQEAKSRMPTLQISEKKELLDVITWRKLAVTGRYLPEYQILVDNKVHQGQVGYYVVTPLQIGNSDIAVLINRGWVKATDSRDKLPVIETPRTTVTVYGTAKLNTKDIVTFSDGNRLGKSWPALVRWVDIKELDQDIPFKFKEYLLLQAPETNQDYIRDWKTVTSPPEKNMSYAVQWFTLAGALLIIFIVVNTKRIQKQDET